LQVSSGHFTATITEDSRAYSEVFFRAKKTANALKEWSHLSSLTKIWERQLLDACCNYATVL